ncbi:hypothetical protein CPC08DRAFT_706071 [Agrocybe pediades]|nr:hypothetical protein CPC08DRAFT_706071 [Agrocybe pediades]
MPESSASLQLLSFWSFTTAYYLQLLDSVSLYGTLASHLCAVLRVWACFKFILGLLFKVQNTP